MPVIINLQEKNEFKLTAAELEAAITPKTKILVLPFPNNPTGSIMTEEDLKPIAELCVKHDIFVISDEIYSELTYEYPHTSIASLPGMKERTVLINGFSKAYAMTGWRLGYACAPDVILHQMLKIHQFAIMCAPTTSQYAAVEALRNGDDDVAMMRESYNQRRRFLVHTFREMGLDCFEPFGAFYIFPSIKSLGMTSDEFAEELLKKEKVAVVPGTAFGDSGEGFLRISYAYSLERSDRPYGTFCQLGEKREKSMSMNIVLLEPEMPANTGNIGRTCVATGTKLHLIKPLGFEITDKMVKRAGLDYWPHLNYEVYENFEDFLEKNPDCIGKLYMATTKARHIYTEVAYEPDSYLMFGKESAGIPEEILVKYEDYCMRIPMEYNIRSLNLSNSVAIVLYEALRQHQFAQMELQGHLHRLHWHEE